MTDLRTAAQQALETIEGLTRDRLFTAEWAGKHGATIAALRAALAQQAEPQDAELSAALGWPGGISDPMLDRKTLLRQVADLRAALAQQAEPVEPAAWLRVIDEAMVTHHLGVADLADDYETAKRKMNNLLCMAQDIGAYFARPQRPAESVPEPVAECIDDICAKHFGRVEAFDHLTTGTKPYTAPPQRKPLTEEEILLAAGWERAEMYMKLAPNFPVDEAKQETLKNARAVERAVWEKNHG